MPGHEQGIGFVRRIDNDALAGNVRLRHVGDAPIGNAGFPILEQILDLHRRVLRIIADDDEFAGLRANLFGVKFAQLFDVDILHTGDRLLDGRHITYVRWVVRAHFALQRQDGQHLGLGLAALQGFAALAFENV